jgi:hypothetical protein
MDNRNQTNTWGYLSTLNDPRSALDDQILALDGNDRFEAIKNVAASLPPPEALSVYRVK